MPKDSRLAPEDFYDVKLLKNAIFIGRLFGRLKENKRIAMRFDKMDHVFLNFVALAIAKCCKLFCQAVPSQ